MAFKSTNADNYSRQLGTDLDYEGLVGSTSSEVGPHPGQRRSGKRGLKRLFAPLLAALAALGKLAGQLKALLLVLPKLKLVATSVSMLVSVGAYALLWGWKFGVGLVALLFVHEMGHVLQLRREGVKASAPMFIPFMGAVIAAKRFGKDVAAEARVGLAGPILGSVGALVPLAIYAATGNPLFKVLAFVGFLLNLFNLVPVLPLDGGRAMAAVSPWMWVLGFAGLVALAFVFPNPIILLILLFGGAETWRRFRQRKSAQSQSYNHVSPRTRTAIACIYLGLTGALVFGMHATFMARGIPTG
jgi:Zn-dependent protease